jgi:hypothetical protein
MIVSALAITLLTFASPQSTEWEWVQAHGLIVEGQGWANVDSPFDRLPKTAKGVVRDPVWSLSRDSSGMAVRFVTDSTGIACRWSLRKSTLSMPHMPATGVSGVDLYVRDPEGVWRWLACPRPTKQNMTATLISDLPEGTREYLLYLPLYNGVQSLEVGVAAGSELKPGFTRAKAKSQPIVFYGTSITHGACASRPGMTHPAILGRRLERPIINLGFSGNGTMDLEMADLMSELDAAVYVIDCLPNMNAPGISERVVPFVKRLRELRALTPILLVEDRSFANAFLQPKKQARHAASRAALRIGFDSLIKNGTKKLYYLEGAELIGNEDTVDASHPTDLGFVRLAGVFEGILKKMLRRP